MNIPRQSNASEFQDKFVQHGTVAELYQLCGMDEDSLTKELLKQCELLPDMSKIKELTN